MLTFVNYLKALPTLEDKQILNKVDKRFRVKNKDLHLIYEGEEFVGICHIRTRLNLFTLIKGGNISLCLAESARGRDLGTQAMDAIIDILSNRNVHKVLVQCVINHGFTNKYMRNKGAKHVTTLFGMNYYVLDKRGEI